MKLEIFASTTNVLRTLMYLEKLLTQEELPAEPESGSEGSSMVEPVQMTRTRTTTALLGVVLMHSVDRLASRADMAGRRPVIMYHYDLGIDMDCELPCRCR